MTDFTRRKMLKFGAVGATVAGVSMLMPSAGFSQCKPDDIKWDESVDVLIIGSGFAGLTAAINLQRKNVGKVLVLEKMQVYGGNSAINGGWLAIPGNPIQLSQGVKDDGPDELVKNQLVSGRGLANEKTLRKAAGRALDVYDLCVKSGVKFKENFNIQVEGHNKPRAIRTEHGTGGDITSRLYEVAKAEGVDMRLQHYVDDVIMDTENASGVKVICEYRYPDKNTGTVKYIKANKALIIATGGYARNVELCSILDPALDTSLDCTNALGATGEVMLNAMSHGALPIHLSKIQTGHWGSPDEGGFGWSNALLSISLYEGMVVNVLNSKRFMDERGDRKYCSESIMKNRNADGSPAYPVAFFSYEDHPSDPRVTRAVRDKMAWKFDSVADMAKFFKMDAKALQASIDEQNKNIKAGKDPLFNRQMDTARPLKAPFVASRMWPKIHYCMGGLKIDDSARVIASTTLKPINKLYAIGEVTGGVHGENRLSSTSCLEAMAMGFIVADTITSDIKKRG